MDPSEFDSLSVTATYIDGVLEYSDGAVLAPYLPPEKAQRNREEALDLSSIRWEAGLSTDAEQDPRTNFARIVWPSDSESEYVGMIWKSPYATNLGSWGPVVADLGMEDLQYLDWAGVTGIEITLSADREMDVWPWVVVSGDYDGCGYLRAAGKHSMSVDVAPTSFVLSPSDFGEDTYGFCTGPLAADSFEHLTLMWLYPLSESGELRVHGISPQRADEINLAKAAAASGMRSPIRIEADTDFTEANGVVAGSGTVTDPYVISGWQISGGQAGITIIGTSAYFEVCDCQTVGGGNGILIKECENGTVQSCHVLSADQDLSGFYDGHGTFGDGICILNSTHIDVRECRVEDSDASGISLYGSSLCNVEGNRLLNNGASGIELSRGSFSNIIQDNLLQGSGWRYESVALEINFTTYDNYIARNLFVENDYGNLQVDRNRNTVADDS